MSNIARMTLDTALLFYRNDQQTIIHRAQASIVNGQVQFGNPQEVTGPLLEDLLALAPDEQTLAIFPERILAYTRDTLAWFIPRAPRKLLFAPDRDKALSALNDRLLPQPPLIMIVQAGRLSVYALTENKWPEASTQLYNAPYFNIFNNHSVCFGSMVRPKSKKPQVISAWEESFYTSQFTHNASSYDRWTSKFTHLELWEAAEQAEEFKPEWLVPTKLTLEQAFFPGKRKS